MTKRLYRSSTNKVIGGICGGIGEYFAVDPVLVRIIAVISCFVGGFGLMAYIIGWIIIPQREGTTSDSDEVSSQTFDSSQYTTWKKYFPGLLLIFFGVLLLIREYGYWFEWDEMIPILLVAVGLALIFKRKKKNSDEIPADAEINSENNQTAQNGGTA